MYTADVCIESCSDDTHSGTPACRVNDQMQRRSAPSCNSISIILANSMRNAATLAKRKVENLKQPHHN
eukprot:11603-Heterococcus_DN1.PRE.1